MKEVKNTSTIQWILAAIGTFIVIAMYIVLRFGFGLDAEALDLTPEDRVLIYVVAGIFGLIYTLLIENITRWTKLGTITFGEKAYNKKHIDGYPVNETSSGFKYVNSNEIIRKGIDLVNINNDMDTFEDIVWFVNMENRQIKYNRLLRNNRKKISKNFKKAKRKRDEEAMALHKAGLDENREHLGLTIDFLEAINTYNKDKTNELDIKLYEIYDITTKEYDAQVLLDDEGTGSESLIDRVRTSQPWYILTGWVLPITIGVIGIVVGFMYEWQFDEILSASEKIILNAVIIYLVTKIPTTAWKAYSVGFKIKDLQPKLNAAHVYKKYMHYKQNHKIVEIPPKKIDDTKED